MAASDAAPLQVMLGAWRYPPRLLLFAVGALLLAPAATSSVDVGDDGLAYGGPDDIDVSGRGGAAAAPAGGTVRIFTPLVKHDVEGRGRNALPVVELWAAYDRPVAGFELTLSAEGGGPLEIAYIDEDSASPGAAVDADFYVQAGRGRSGQLIGFSRVGTALPPTNEAAERGELLLRVGVEMSALARGVCVKSAVFAEQYTTMKTVQQTGGDGRRKPKHRRQQRSMRVELPSECAARAHRRWHVLHIVALFALLGGTVLIARRYRGGDKAMHAIARKMA